MIAALIVMAVFVGTALANGEARISAHKQEIGDNETNFFTNEDVYARGYLGDYSSPDQGGRIFVVDHKVVWTNGDSLNDVSNDGIQAVSWDADGNFNYILTWPELLTAGRYDLILDLNVGAGGIWTDSGNITDPIWTFDVTVPADGINIEKTASPTAGPSGTDVTFTIAVENIGDSTLTLAMLEDVLPEGMSFVSADSGGTELPEGTITWLDLGPLDPHDSTRVSLVARIDPDASGTLTDNVIVIAMTDDNKKITDFDTADVNVEEQPPTPVEIPTLMPKGTIALVCLVFVVSSISIIMRRRGT